MGLDDSRLNGNARGPRKLPVRYTPYRRNRLGEGVSNGTDSMRGTLIRHQGAGTVSAKYGGRVSSYLQALQTESNTKGQQDLP